MLHPQARALLDLIEKSGIPPTHTLADGTILTLYLVWHSPTVDTQEATA
jgi:hypothetical protein